MYFMYLDLCIFRFVLVFCLSVCATCVPGACGDEERSSGSLVVNHHVGAETKSLSLVNDRCSKP